MYQVAPTDDQKKKEEGMGNGAVHKNEVGPMDHRPLMLTPCRQVMPNQITSSTRPRN